MASNTLSLSRLEGLISNDSSSEEVITTRIYCVLAQVSILRK